MGKHQCAACKRTFRTAQGLGLHFNHARKNPKVCDGQPRIDPRDAEIAALKAEVEALKVKINSESWLSDKRAAERDNAERDLAAHRRALAAGPAALRAQVGVHMGGLEACARVVEAAQAAAMKGKP